MCLGEIGRLHLYELEMPSHQVLIELYDQALVMKKARLLNSFHMGSCNNIIS